MTRTRLQTSNIAGERLNWNSNVERNLDYHKKKGLKWIRSEMLPFNGRSTTASDTSFCSLRAVVSCILRARTR